jgi:hypothetical protein
MDPTPVATAARLLDALDELITQENILIRTMDFVEAVQVRERAAPIVDKLCELASEPVAAALRSRLDVLLGRCDQNYRLLEGHLAQMQEELSRVSQARGRLRHFAPVYKTGSARVESQLNTAA